MIAKMRNGGEACTSANRFHVADVGRRRVRREARGADRRAEGRPRHRARRQGRPAHRRRPARQGRRARRGRASARARKVLVGGERVDGAGYFYAPTVLADVPDGARLLREEIFGPVAPVQRFASEDEAIAAANDTEYGLVAYVYTQDISRAFRVIEQLDTGMIGLNQGMVSNAGAPFGGVKQSGFGREGGPEGIAGVPGDEVRRDERSVAGGVRFVDLSAPIVRARADAPDLAAHRDRARRPRARARARSRRCSASPPELLRDGEGWAVETFTRFGTHNSTHVDAPWHYNSTIGGERARRSTSCRSSGSTRPASCSTSTAKADGEAVDRRRGRGRARAHRPRARAAGHRAGAHRPRRLLRRARLHGARARRHRRGDALALRPRRPRHGHRRLGLGPAAAPAGRGGAGRGRARASSGPPIRRTSPYSQIERLATSPSCRPRASRVACFPLRIAGASAAPARVVAMLDE